MNRAADDLVACATAFVTASAAAGDRPDDAAAASEVLAARLSLFECLIAAGWSAPEGVEHQMRLDVLMLQEDDADAVLAVSLESRRP